MHADKMEENIEDLLAKHVQTKTHMWAIFREVVVHEDNLVNHRLTWLFTFEGFILGAFFVVQGAVASARISSTFIFVAELFLAIVFSGAMWICLITNRSISQAFEHISRVDKSWCRMFPDEATQSVLSSLPTLLGKFRNRKIINTRRIPIILFIVNTAAVTTCAFVIWASLFHPSWTIPSASATSKRYLLV